MHNTHVTNPSLLPIGVDSDSSGVYRELSELVAKIASAGPKMDVFCGSTAVAIIAAFDKYYCGEIDAAAMCNRLKSVQLPN